MATKRKPAARRGRSPLIPIVVGIVTLAIITGAVISLENQRPASAALPAGATPAPLPTMPVPNPGIPRLSLQELQDKIAQGEVILVDARSKASYDKAHVQGAMSFPEGEFDVRLGDLPRDKGLVLYCT